MMSESPPLLLNIKYIKKQLIILADCPESRQRTVLNEGNSYIVFPYLRK